MTSVGATRAGSSAVLCGLISQENNINNAESVRIQWSAPLWWDTKTLGRWDASNMRAYWRGPTPQSKIFFSPLASATNLQGPDDPRNSSEKSRVLTEALSINTPMRFTQQRTIATKICENRTAPIACTGMKLRK